MTTDTTVKEDLTPDETPAPQTREQFFAQVQEAQERSTALQESMTQREWMAARRALDMTREEILADGGVRLVVLSYVAALRHGEVRASWDTFLNMTDDEISELHGYPTRMPEGVDPVPASSYAVSEHAIEEARAKANFCLRLHVSPRDYDDLTDVERAQFIEEYDRIRAAYEASTNG